MTDPRLGEDLAKSVAALLAAYATGDRHAAVIALRELVRMGDVALQLLPADAPDRAPAVERISKFREQLAAAEKELEADAKARAENMLASGDALHKATLARRGLEAEGRTTQVAIMNVAQFALLWNRDLTTLLADLRDGGDPWRVKLHARLLAATMFECVDDFSELLGGDFRRQTGAMSGSTLAQLNALHGRLEQFKRTNREDLGQIRVTVLAHRDKDASVQLRAMESIDVAHIIRLGTEMLDWTNDLYAYLSALI